MREKFNSELEYKKALKIHEACRKFFEEDFEKLKVYMSLHQIAEIFHVLAFRGHKIPLDEAIAIVESILDDDNIVKVPVLAEHLKEAFEESKETGIHVWDFLCFIPLKNYVDVIYTLDKHFVTIGKRYGVEVVNPAREWLRI